MPRQDDPDLLQAETFDAWRAACGDQQGVAGPARSRGVQGDVAGAALGPLRLAAELELKALQPEPLWWS